MIPYTLFIESRSENGDTGDRLLKKELRSTVLPRINEQIDLIGTAFTVTGVTHNISKDIVEVYVVAEDADFDQLLGRDGYELLHGGASTTK